VRRAIELAWSQRGGVLHLLALDWAKAFDSISTTALLVALRRFGVPEPFVEMVAAIYEGRMFCVRECGHQSEEHMQGSGICQGCPLSPLLFAIVMTILLENARKLLSTRAQEDLEKHMLFDILYADDTLICGTRPGSVEEYAAAVGKAGADFGLCLHWGKTQAVSVCSTESLHSPQGDHITDTGCMTYLGGLLTADGHVDSELSRRIGAAAGEFKALRTFWGHANICRKRKLQLFHSFVASKLQYGLSTVWLGTAQRRRLDGFYARCLRRVLGVPSAYVTRVSNKTVFQRAGVLAFSDQVLRRQLLLLGKVAFSPADAPLRKDVFVEGSLRPQIGRYVRRVGRPRQDWLSEVWKSGACRLGGELRMRALLQSQEQHPEAIWRCEADKAFRV